LHVKESLTNLLARLIRLLDNLSFQSFRYQKFVFVQASARTLIAILYVHTVLHLLEHTLNGGISQKGFSGFGDLWRTFLLQQRYSCMARVSLTISIISYYTPRWPLCCNFCTTPGLAGHFRLQAVRRGLWPQMNTIWPRRVHQSHVDPKNVHFSACALHGIAYGR